MKRRSTLGLAASDLIGLCKTESSMGRYSILTLFTSISAALMSQTAFAGPIDFHVSAPTHISIPAVHFSGHSVQGSAPVAVSTSGIKTASKFGNHVHQRGHDDSNGLGKLSNSGIVPQVIMTMQKDAQQNQTAARQESNAARQESKTGRRDQR
jgi:hypothetical protein